MALVLDDLVKETTATTGTGTVSLAGAVSNYQTFVAGVGSGNVCYYTIIGQGDFETGKGTVTASSPDTLSRDTVFSSSNSDAKVAFAAGSKDVFVTIPASKSVFKDLNDAALLSNGTAALPGLVFASDPDTGIFRPAANSLAFTTGGSDRGRFDSSGNFIVGRSSASPSVVGSDFLSDGQIRGTVSGGRIGFLNRLSTDGSVMDFARDDVVKGNISISSGITTFNDLSDRRAKNSIRNLPVAGEMQRVRALKVKEFEFNDNPGRKHVGFIAQDVQLIYPDAVSVIVEEERDEQGVVIVEEKLGMDYGKMVVPLKLALDEAIDTITDLKARISALEAAP